MPTRAPGGWPGSPGRELSAFVPGGAQGWDAFCWGVPGRAGQAGRGGPPPAWVAPSPHTGHCPAPAALLPAATQKTAGTCPGPQSLRCYNCRSPGSDLQAWAACPAGGRKRKPWGSQLTLPGTRTPQEPSLLLLLMLIPLGGSPATGSQSRDNLRGPQMSRAGKLLSPGKWHPSRSTQPQDITCACERPSQDTGWTRTPPVR